MKRALALAMLLAAGIGLNRAIDSFGGDPVARAPGTDLARSFLGNLSYEIRGTLARLLYLKIDKYVHEGKKIDLGNGMFGITASGNTDIVPLYGIIAYLDPHFLEAISFGGDHLIHGLNKPAEGVAMIELGVADNPGDPLTSELLGQLGVYWMQERGDPQKAIALFERALELRRQADEAKVPHGFVFSAQQLVGLLASANYRAGRIDEAIRWIRQPNNLDEEHDLYYVLGLKTRGGPAPASPPAGQPPAGAPRSARPPHEHEHEEAEARLSGNPRWWVNSVQKAAFYRKLGTGALLALFLALPLPRFVARLLR